jgi:hypothetical protein
MKWLIAVALLGCHALPTDEELSYERPPPAETDSTYTGCAHPGHDNIFIPAEPHIHKTATGPAKVVAAPEEEEMSPGKKRLMRQLKSGG